MFKSVFLSWFRLRGKGEVLVYAFKLQRSRDQRTCSLLLVDRAYMFNLEMNFKEKNEFNAEDLR